MGIVLYTLLGLALFPAVVIGGVVLVALLMFLIAVPLVWIADKLL